MRLAEFTTTSPRSEQGPLKKVIILLLVLGSVIGLFVYQTISPGQAALLVESNLPAVVNVDGVQKGKTPLEIEMKASEVTIKIVAEGTTAPLSPYIAKVKLAKGVKTIVRHNFGESEGDGSGQILSFERQIGEKANVAIISIPDKVLVELDGQNIGSTPLKFSTEPGSHVVKLSALGYETSEFEINATRGFALTVIAELPHSVEPAPLNSVATAKEARWVEILETPNGFLRVRTIPDIESEEIGRVETGKRYELLEESGNKEWFRIIFSPSESAQKEGWVSSQFAKIST